MSIAELESFLHQHFHRRANDVAAVLAPSAAVLTEAVLYSLNSGGKRFRPQVAFLTAELLGVSADRVVPHAAAVELIHTYSLIHDDLPAMDNDTYRRGQLTNHVKFGEANALLAGDALLTEAFYILGDNYRDVPELGLELTHLLAEAAGLTGMVAGQVVDMKMSQDHDQSASRTERLIAMHRQKTGALIRYSAEGVAVLARLKPVEREQIRHLGADLGLAFQVADDLLDHDPTAAEANGLPFQLGVEKTREMLAALTRECLEILRPFGPRAAKLAALVEKNQNRQA